MSEETKTEETAAAADEAPAEAPAVVVDDRPEHAKYTYYVAGNLQHDHTFYPTGSTIEGKLMTAEQFKILRKDGVLKYQSEVEDAAGIAAATRAKEEQLREQQAEIESLRRQLAAAQKASKKL